MDFACIDLKLIVELDGSQHLDQQDYDEKRSWYLCRLGYRVVRSWNNEALNDSEGVLAALSELVN